MSRIDRVTGIEIDMRLARDGGPRARTRPEHPMFPGGMELGDEEAEAAARVIRSHNVFRYYGVGDGPHEVVDFEREFAAYMGSTHALAVNAGSSALICGLIGSGVRPGDEVIVPAYTWNATANAVVACRAVPVLAEVDESLTLDPEDVERKLTARTRAILPVHMRGAPADMDALDGARRRARPRPRRGRLPGERRLLPRAAARHVRRRGRVQPPAQQDPHRPARAG